METEPKASVLRVAKAWVPVMAWGALIFAGSTDLGSTAHTSRFIVPFLHWLIPTISEETVRTVQTIVRKCAHLSEYAILGMLIWRGWRVHRGAGWEWVWKEIPAIVAACALYAASDEFHQSFVSTRESSARDVLIDSVGATVGLLVLWGMFRLWRHLRLNVRPVG